MKYVFLYFQYVIIFFYSNKSWKSTVWFSQHALPTLKNLLKLLKLHIDWEKILAVYRMNRMNFSIFLSQWSFQCDDDVFIASSFKKMNYY